VSKHRRPGPAAEAAEALLTRRLRPSPSATSVGWVPQRPAPDSAQSRDASSRSLVDGLTSAHSTVRSSTLERWRWVPTRRAATGLGVVLLLAVLVTVLMVWRAQPSAEAAPHVHRDTPVALAPAEPVPAPSSASPDEVAPSEVVVHVVGAVHRPGIVHLPTGSRVADAVDAAGGATSRGQLASVNLARVLVDGEQIVVQRRGGSMLLGAPGTAGAAASPGGAAAASPTAPVDLNTATLEALDGLPGIGPVLAQRILDWRAANGRFSTVDELGEVSGIGEATLADLRPLVRV
jgi:competence protein ComEA